LIKYSVIGGTASVIGGGKFANGAMTGAFQYLVNEATANRSRGLGAQTAVVKDLMARGFDVIENVRLQVMLEGGVPIEAIADYAYREGDQIVFGEVKDGLGARFTQNQKIVYDAIVEGRVKVVNIDHRIALEILPGEKYAASLSVHALAGSRAMRQVASRWGVKAIGGVLTILGSGIATAADLFLISPDLGANSDCVGCLNGGR
jgi:hypothetical protein